ncbi:hypothetical protein NDA16_001868 [Ustilago loliicola]|nr:hypothetical protein NDA16_001868 [Ustilago loliicola]
MNRSTSITPPATTPAPSPHILFAVADKDDDDDDNLFVSQSFRTPRKSVYPDIPSPPPHKGRHLVRGSLLSPQVSQDAAVTDKGKEEEQNSASAASPKKNGKEQKEEKDGSEGDLLAKEGVKRGKKRARNISKESEEDEREISAGLHIAGSSKLEGTKVGCIGSPSKKRGEDARNISSGPQVSRSSLCVCFDPPEGAAEEQPTRYAWR